MLNRSYCPPQGTHRHCHPQTQNSDITGRCSALVSSGPSRLRGQGPLVWTVRTTCGAVSEVQEEGRGQRGMSGRSRQAWRGCLPVTGFTGKRQEEEEEAGLRSQPSVQAVPPWNPSPPRVQPVSLGRSRRTDSLAASCLPSEGTGMTHARWGAQGAQLRGKTDVEQASAVTARHHSPRPGRGQRAEGVGENTKLNKQKQRANGQASRSTCIYSPLSPMEAVPAGSARREVGVRCAVVRLHGDWTPSTPGCEVSLRLRSCTSTPTARGLPCGLIHPSPLLKINGESRLQVPSRKRTFVRRFVSDVPCSSLRRKLDI